MRPSNFVFSLFAIGIPGFALCMPWTTQAHTESIYCGSASNGLGVNAVTTQPKQNACPEAIEVANAYIQLNYKREPVVITIKGKRWICRERQGDTNPYGECAMQRNPDEKVILTS
ncbi:hypothetical protein HRJ41_17415 [Pseudomonas sp. BF61]|uniref:hypothetical protein n=1 Tax=Pseudomonas sp. BF61 TaxID=2741068 RepID=UPI001C0BD55A|nr:hypothetical protein [Pseudomonas sp. BF61]MBU4629258.1 hypothetical protein [Pseudomonas sp. BF61]